MEKKVIASRIQTPDGTILWSRHTHDYVAYKDTKTGEVYMLDGGTDYMKTSVNQVPAKNVSIYNTAKWKTLRDFIIRNTMLLNENKKPTLKTGFVKLSSMSDEHLVDLKEYLTERGIRKEMIEYIKKEQKYRKENGISIPEHDYTPELVDCIELGHG